MGRAHLASSLDASTYLKSEDGVLASNRGARALGRGSPPNLRQENFGREKHRQQNPMNCKIP
jgi:hypothetical protein